MRLPVSFACLPPLLALNQQTAPAVRRRIADRAEQPAAGRRVMTTVAKHQCRFEREAGRVLKPGRVILEGRAFAALPASRPQPADEMQLAVEIDIDEKLPIGHIRLFAGVTAISDALRQALLFELESNLVRACVGKMFELRDKSENEQHGRVGAERDAGIAALNLKQRRSRNEGARCHDRRRNAPPQPRAADVRAELSERPLDGQRQRVGFAQGPSPNVYLYIRKAL